MQLKRVKRTYQIMIQNMFQIQKPMSEDDEPPSSLAKSTFLADKESSMMVISDISGITRNETSTNTTDSTSIAKGLNFCFVCKKANFKIARHFKVHVKKMQTSPKL